jgi:hypothetical protein
MQAKSVNFSRLIHYTTITAICLCLCLLSSTVVRAQKTPSIFKTEDRDKGRSLSATNMAYINELEAEYRRLESSDSEKAKVIRNKLIFIAVEQIDTEFNNYRRKSRKRNELLQFILDFLEIGAATAIAVTNGERAKEVIAEALTGFKGARASFNKNFKLLEFQILFNKMVTNRSQRLSAIYENLNADVDSYPWERARTELRDYFYAGTIDDALNSLSIDTGAEASDSQAALEAVKVRAGIVGEPTQAEVDESKTNFSKIRDILKVGLVAERDLNAERQKAEANQDKAKITQLETTRKNVLDDLRTLFDLIEADTKLKPLLDMIPEEFSKDNPSLKPRFEAALNRLKNNTSDVSLSDYDLILPKLNSLIVASLSKDPALAGRLNTILSSSKTLKTPTP